MTAQEIRKAYLDFFKARGHVIIPRAQLVPQNDPTTLFTGSGMQPMVPYLLGEPHPEGQRIADSQTCLRAQDIDEVGDNRHTTFFEMLGNWSLGDYFKQEQLPWIFELLTDVVGLDPQKLYVTCFIGSEKYSIPKDNESGDIWQRVFTAKGIEAGKTEVGSEQNAAQVGIPIGARIVYYDATKNWWCRNGKIDNMPVGEPGGPSSEVFYEFDFVEHNPKYGQRCHPNCDCGRFVEIGNNVLMEYKRVENGFEKLPKNNIDFGGGLERIAMAAINSPDVFKSSVFWPIIIKLEELSGKKYDSHTESMRVIADHLRAATFLAVDGVVPSNKEQGYVMRRLVRRAIRFAFEIGIEQNFLEQIVPVIADLYHDDFPEVAERHQQVINVLVREEKIFRTTLRKGLQMFERKVVWVDMKTGKKYDHPFASQVGGDNPIFKREEFSGSINGADLYNLFDTHGFPVELSIEEAFKLNIELDADWRLEFDRLMQEQKDRSKTASRGVFKGGLADHSEQVTKYHTATHLLHKALRTVLGDHVVQRGSNITAERLRFDFSHEEKMTPEQIKQVEDIVNENIARDWPMGFTEMSPDEAFKTGALGAFGDKYGDKVKVYTAGDPNGEWFSKEICGGPHVQHTGQLAEGGKQFKITKEESSSAGVRRVKAVLQ